MLIFFFFFQAEDGIRDVAVTGVQTCALPISCAIGTTRSSRPWITSTFWPSRARSEERRVGKSVDLGGRRIIKKKRVKIKTRAGVVKKERKQNINNYKEDRTM